MDCSNLAKIVLKIWEWVLCVYYLHTFSIFSPNQLSAPSIWLDIVAFNTGFLLRTYEYSTKKSNEAKCLEYPQWWRKDVQMHFKSLLRNYCSHVSLTSDFGITHWLQYVHVSMATLTYFYVISRPERGSDIIRPHDPPSAAMTTRQPIRNEVTF